MQKCEIPTENILPPTLIHMEIDDQNCDFDCVKEAAIERAESYDNAPKLLSWFDKKRQTYYPGDECCVENEPSWLAYAEAKGADLAIDVNHESYVFVFRKSHGLP